MIFFDDRRYGEHIILYINSKSLQLNNRQMKNVSVQTENTSAIADEAFECQHRCTFITGVVTGVILILVLSKNVLKI